MGRGHAVFPPSKQQGVADEPIERSLLWRDDAQLAELCATKWYAGGSEQPNIEVCAQGVNQESRIGDGLRDAVLSAK
jgi:hypothetical protein